jgi:hypothetical protein
LNSEQWQSFFSVQCSTLNCHLNRTVEKDSMPCQHCGAVLPADARFCPGCGAHLETLRNGPEDPLRDALEKAIGFQYRIERLLGRGGMGAVYLAHELALDRDVAIKVLPPEHAVAAHSRERFVREARTAARLNHPNIVPLYTFGQVGGLFYFVMGYVPGDSLAARLRRDGPMAPTEASTMLAEIADALSYAHCHGIIHRDIKPDNILIDAESGSPRLTDFGISKAIISDSQLTTEGQLVGTPTYMSPEQALGRIDIDPRSDLYSLGIVGYQMLSGCLPFAAATPMEELTQRLTKEAQPLRTIALHAPEYLSTAIHRCLQRDPADRWPDAKSLRFELMPTDDETDDPLPMRVLRICTIVTAIIAPAAVALSVFGRLSHGPAGIRMAAPALIGAAGGLVMMGLAATAVLLRLGFGIRSILYAAFRQPRGWRFWYPKRFRRRGDIWERLPARIRRVRVYFAITLAWTFWIYVPVMLGLMLSRSAPARQVFMEVFLGGVLVIGYLQRRRAIKEISGVLGISAIEASKIMSAPSWRTSVWHRAPAASLLRGETRSPARSGPLATATSAVTNSPDRPTTA